MKKLGLVGGTSWISTIDYYRFINEGINETLGGLNFAELIIYSINFNEYQQNNTAGNWNATYELLHKASESLKSSGAEAIVLCANTSHAVANRLEATIDLPIIHIVTAVAQEINKRGMKKVGLIGTKFTMEMDFYKEKLRGNGIEAIVPASPDIRDFMQYRIKEEMGKGVFTQETNQFFISIMNDLVKEGAEGIILGCTELPLLINQEDIKVPVFDTTKIHAKAAVKFALS
ncbi:MAG TPA: aspartate/glutamate racemase family protein [Chitinophagaceae bacterium]|nr:aspartate/glutamate racemase family protein [Chitinophagaceae bacterium]